MNIEVLKIVRDNIEMGSVLSFTEVMIIQQAIDAVMLQAEPVSQHYKLPQTQFEQVADLYEMQFDDGRTCAFHTDAEKAVQWLHACDGNKVQEYVKLERLQDALTGNSPVIPDDWQLVPVDATLDMLKEGAKQNMKNESFQSVWKAMLAAAPQQEGV